MLQSGSAIAEKFQAMVSLGDANSRMKDFYDIYTLSRQFNFKGEELAEAIRLTFTNRQTEIPMTVSSFRKEFIDLKEVQWRAFRKTLGQNHVPESFAEVVADVDKFLTPLTLSLLSGTEIPGSWTAPGPWT